MSIEKAQLALPIFHKFNLDAKSTDVLPADLKEVLLPVAWANRSMRTLGDPRSEPSLELRHVSSIAEILVADQTDSQFIVTRGSDGLALCWLNKEQRLKEPVARVHTVTKMGITADAKYLIAGHSNGQVCRWTLGLEPTYESPQAPTGRPVTALDVCRISSSPGLTALVNDGVALMYDMNEDPPQLLETWKSENAALERVFVLNDGKTLLNTIPNSVLDMTKQSDLEAVNQLRLRMNQLTALDPLLTMPRISRTAVAADGSLLVFGCDNSTEVDLCLLETRPLIKVLPPPNLRAKSASASAGKKKQHRITALAVSSTRGNPPANWIAAIQEVNFSEENQNSPNQADLAQKTEANFLYCGCRGEPR
jgi:hypothetical protein